MRTGLHNEGFASFVARYNLGRDRTRVPRGPDQVRACDRLASLTENPDSRAPGVLRDKINAPLAIEQCTAAIEHEPNTPRLRLQLARSLAQSAQVADQNDASFIVRDLTKDGYAAAFYLAGAWFARARQWEQSVGFMRQAADRGLAVAMSDLGYFYDNGRGVPKSQSEAVQWFERAAAGGDPSGMRNLALALDQGLGGPADPARAADLLITAFRMGLGDARKSLFERMESWTPQTRIEVQKILKDFGLYSGPLNGTFGPPTFAALNKLVAPN
jgi:hypothetical protein